MVGFNTNKGLECQNQVFKHSYLHQYKNSSLSSMLTILIATTGTHLLQSDLYLHAEGLEEHTCLGWMVLPIMDCTGGSRARRVSHFA